MTGMVVFTDLDGTLLDASTFDAGPARAVLRRLREEGIPVVPVTSKTRAELVPLLTDLELPGPAVFESGGGILRAEGDGWTSESIGPRAGRLRRLARSIERETGASLRFLGQMSREEAAARTGLSGGALDRALDRRFDEPFVLDGGRLDDVVVAARKLDLAVEVGGRFLHLRGAKGKGDAVAALRLEFARGCPDGVRTVGLGDAPMDASFLALTDIPVIVPMTNGRPHPALRKALPGARVAPEPGPAGWARAMEGILEETGVATRSPGGKR